MLNKQSLAQAMMALGFAIASLSVNATTVQFQTTQGNFEVNLYDRETPITVDNFLFYVNEGRYTDTLVHRSVSNFIIQGGGFGFAEEQTTLVDTSSAIQNEPYFSNVRATIAMAKLSGRPNSATSQWFINISNNSLVLDDQNSGFTVFGEVTSGMDVVQRINGLPIANLPTFDSQIFLPFLGDETPIADFSQEDAEIGEIPNEENLVYITSIVVLDGAENTIGTVETPINPIHNPSCGTQSDLTDEEKTDLGCEVNDRDSGGDGGGSFPPILIAMLALGGLRRFRSQTGE